MQLKILSIFSLLLFFMLAQASYAAISCDTCKVDSICSCDVTDCSGGIMKFYSTASCAGVAESEYDFSLNKFVWQQDVSGSFYMKGFCIDGNKTNCVLLQVHPSGAEISCDKCYVDSCSCSISTCNSGILKIYEKSGCSGTASFEIDFSAKSFSWHPEEATSYYMKAYCLDGVTHSTCNEIDVYEKVATTTTTSTTTKNRCPHTCCVDEESYIDKPCPEGFDCIENVCVEIQNPSTINYNIIVVVFIVIAATVCLVYYLLLKGKSLEWQTLKKKWSR